MTRAGAALVGSPQQIIDKIMWWHELFGHSVQQLSLDVAGTMPTAKQRAALELFMAEVAPVLRREAPTAVWSTPTTPERRPETSPRPGTDNASSSAGRTS